MNKKVVVPIWWFFWIIYLEFIYRIFIVGNFFTMNTLSVVLFSFLWIIFFSLLTTLFKERVTSSSPAPVSRSNRKRPCPAGWRISPSPSLFFFRGDEGRMAQ